jgi:hypothetical protein
VSRAAADWMGGREEVQFRSHHVNLSWHYYYYDLSVVKIFLSRLRASSLSFYLKCFNPAWPSPDKSLIQTKHQTTSVHINYEALSAIAN